MKHIASLTCLVVGLVWLAITAPSAFAEASQQSSAPIPMDQLGAVAGKQYQGDGLSVIATPDGARLRCAFQRLEGQVTREGLWLSSTADNNSGERFRVMAMEVGRSEKIGVRRQSVAATPLFEGDWMTTGVADFQSGVALRFPPQSKTLPKQGVVSINDQRARFIRPGLTEEYTVSVDGVRQDFIIEQRPEGDGELRVELDVTGATAEPLVNGARLVLDGSGRKLAYNRLRVTDSTGRELSARMEVTGSARVSRAVSGVAPETSSNHSSVLAAAEINVERDFRRDAGNNTPEACAPRLSVLVDDAAAIYPVRIDPTFSDSDWISMGSVPGVNNIVDVLAISGSDVYAAGIFTSAGGVAAFNVAKWDGSIWSPLGAGVYGVRSLAVSGSNVYAGGFFTAAGGIAAANIAKWNGSSWSALGSGMNSAVNALAVSGNDLYAAGNFLTAGGITVNRVAKWDGSSWSALGSGTDGFLNALAVSGNNLYVAGYFTTAGGITATNIAKWDGSSWSALGSGMNSAANALAMSGNNLYVAGNFTTAGGIAATNIAKWDGVSWSALGFGLNGPVGDLAASGSNIYAIGSFTTAGTIPANRIAKWDGSSWSALGSGLTNAAYANAVAASGSDVYVGGSFTTAGGMVATNIARWNGNSWNALGGGMDNPVWAFAVSGSNVYAAGNFTTAGGISASRIAKWNGTNWTALGSGINTSVYALAASGSDLYAGGPFNFVGGSFAFGVAKWNGSSWIGFEDIGDVRALAVVGTNLYAGGLFSGYIKRWNGSNFWINVGSGINNRVNALAVSGSNLYVGGGFTTAGGMPANRIAKWNGTNWSALGSGLSGSVYAMAVSGDDLYVGGNFTTAGGIPANNVAKWNGSSWVALGSGLSVWVYSLAVSGSDLYAGGNILTAGGSAVNGVAKWDGSSWGALGSGVSYGPSSVRRGSVYALAISGSELYVGGDFIFAGGQPSGFIAKAKISAARGRFSNLVFPTDRIQLLVS